MKMDIEALARKAGLSSYPEEREAFARLIVERCAVEAWNHTMDTCTKNRIPVVDNYKFCCAAAIRQLLEDK